MYEPALLAAATKLQMVMEAKSHMLMRRERERDADAGGWPQCSVQRLQYQARPASS